MKRLNSLGPFQVKLTNFGSSTDVNLQPIVLSLFLSLGFQKSSYLPPTFGSTSA